MELSKSATAGAHESRRGAMLALFTEHPASVGESYGEHFRFAGRFSLMLFGAGLAAATHAVLPFLFKKTASRLIASMYAETAGRGRPAHDRGADWSI